MSGRGRCCLDDVERDGNCCWLWWSLIGGFVCVLSSQWRSNLIELSELARDEWTCSRGKLSLEINKLFSEFYSMFHQMFLLTKFSLHCTDFVFYHNRSFQRPKLLNANQTSVIQFALKTFYRGFLSPQPSANVVLVRSSTQIKTFFFVFLLISSKVSHRTNVCTSNCICCWRGRSKKRRQKSFSLASFRLIKPKFDCSLSRVSRAIKLACARGTIEALAELIRLRQPGSSGSQSNLIFVPESRALLSN